MTRDLRENLDLARELSSLIRHAAVTLLFATIVLVCVVQIVSGEEPTLLFKMLKALSLALPDVR